MRLAPAVNNNNNNLTLVLRKIHVNMIKCAVSFVLFWDRRKQLPTFHFKYTKADSSSGQIIQFRWFLLLPRRMIKRTQITFVLGLYKHKTKNTGQTVFQYVYLGELQKIVLYYTHHESWARLYFRRTLGQMIQLQSKFVYDG